MTRKERAKKQELTVVAEKPTAALLYGQYILFGLLIAVLITIIATNADVAYPFDFAGWYVNLPICVLLLIENAVKFWGIKRSSRKIACYVFDVLCILTLTVFSDGTFCSLLYMIILSEFYLSQKKISSSIAMCVTSVALFLVTFVLSGVFKSEELNVGKLISNTFNDLLLLFVHFVIMCFSVQIAQKNKELNDAVENANKTNEKLRVAYEELKEITALEERQRIAKDIHDAAGHSITTVIMQTEAAKLAVDCDKEEAKRRIAAANLQAKHALEELRESVHLLSGLAEAQTLKEQLLSIVQDSTDGTGVVIRTDVDEITLCDAKSRLICNTLKEGISNGLRHGGATAFYFELKERNAKINFLLSDNGTGMKLSALKEGFGLSGMQKRASSLGGTVWFETEPEEGFEIHLTLPSDGERGERL